MNKKTNLKKMPIKKLFKLKIAKIISEDLNLKENLRGKKCLKDFDKINCFHIENVFHDDIKIYTEGDNIFLRYGIAKDHILGSIHYEKKFPNKIIVNFEKYGKMEIIFKTK